MALIPETTVDEILRRSNIVEVINSFVPLAKAGNGNWKACCPFHKEKTPSFHVSETKQMYYCFGCQKGGNIITFLREYQNTDYVGALRFLADRYHVVIPESVSPAEEKAYRERRSQNERLLLLHKEINDLYMRELRSRPDSPVARYFATRAIPWEFADRFRIGAAPDSFDAALRHGKALGFTEEEMVASGIVIRNEAGRLYDRFRNRLTFAITDESDRVIGFSARIIVKDDNAPKYVNSPETAIFHKGEILYGFAQARDAIRRSNFAIVCEGQLDTIALHRAGLEMAVAPQGLAFRPEQAELLKHQTNTIYLCFDSDAAGQSGTFRVLEFLLPMNMEVKALALEGGKDPDEIMKTQGPEVLHQALKEAVGLVAIVVKSLAVKHDLASAPGRARAADYVKRVSSCYRRAADAVCDGTYTPELAASLKAELAGVFNRGFWDGYYQGARLGEWSAVYGSQATRHREYIGKVTNWFNRIDVAEIRVETGGIRTGDEIAFIGKTTGCLEMKVDDIRVDLKPVSEAPKGVFCSVAVPVENQPVDHVNNNPAKEADERIHPRRGDKVFKWVED